MNIAVFEKTMENVNQHKDIKFVTTERRRNYLLEEPNHHTKNIFMEYLLTIEMKKTQILRNKPVYLGLSILEVSKILIYEFQYDYVKPKYGEQIKLCDMNTDNFVVYIKTDDTYKDIAEGFETRFDNSDYELV